MTVYETTMATGITRTKEFERKQLASFAVNVGTPTLQVPDPVNPVSRSRQKQIDEASRAAEAILQGRDPESRSRRPRIG